MVVSVPLSPEKHYSFGILFAVSFITPVMLDLDMEVERALRTILLLAADVWAHKITVDLFCFPTFMRFSFVFFLLLRRFILILGRLHIIIVGLFYLQFLVE